MRYRHICASHATQLQLNEYTAWEYWQRLLQQGVQMFAHQRWQCAKNYLAGAFEVALLRQSMHNNILFGDMQVLKPAEFLLEVYVKLERFACAEEMLEQICDLLDQANGGLKDEFTIVVDAFYRKLNQAKANAEGHYARAIEKQSRPVLH